MNGLTINAKTVNRTSRKPAVLHIHAGKTVSRLYFSAAAVAKLGLKAGDRISFRLYAGEPLVYFYKDVDGLMLRKDSAELKWGNRLAIYSRETARQLMEHLGCNPNTGHSFKITGKTTQLNDVTKTAWFIQL